MTQTQYRAAIAAFMLFLACRLFWRAIFAM